MKLLRLVGVLTALRIARRPADSLIASPVAGGLLYGLVYLGLGYVAIAAIARQANAGDGMGRATREGDRVWATGFAAASSVLLARWMLGPLRPTLSYVLDFTHLVLLFGVIAVIVGFRGVWGRLFERLSGVSQKD